MIVVDASAIVAIVAREADGADIARRLDVAPYGAGLRHASTVTVWEAASGIARLNRVDRSRAFHLVNRFCDLAGIEPVAPDMTITALAIEAAQRYGRGAGYPGILNLGDCFSYATARHLGAALLFKGNDFSRTDIAAA